MANFKENLQYIGNYAIIKKKAYIWLVNRRELWIRIC